MNCKIVALGIIVALYGAQAIGDDRRNDDRKLRETQVSYDLHYKGGASERVVVKYEAMLNAHVYQSGSASKPLQGHPSDNRQCHVDVNARVYRRAYLISVSGIQAPVEEYQAVYQALTSKARGASSDIEGLTYHKTCGDVNNFQDFISAADGELIAQFDTLVAKDDDKARERLRAMLKGNTIEKGQ